MAERIPVGSQIWYSKKVGKMRWQRATGDAKRERRGARWDAGGIDAEGG